MKRQLRVIPLHLLLAPTGRDQALGISFTLLREMPWWLRIVNWFDQILHKVSWYWYLWIITLQIFTVSFALYDSWEHIGLIRLLWLQDVLIVIGIASIPALQRLRFVLSLICAASVLYLFILVRSIFF